MLDDDIFELDEDLLNATDFSQKFDETGMLLVIHYHHLTTKKINSQFLNLFFIIPIYLVNSGEEISQNLRYLNCTGEDHANKHSFDTHSFIVNDEIKLIESNLKKFHSQKLFDLDFSENVLTDPAILQSLLGKARYRNPFGQLQIQ